MRGLGSARSTNYVHITNKIAFLERTQLATGVRPRKMPTAEEFTAEYPSGLRGRIANPLFVGSNPTSAYGPLITTRSQIKLKSDFYR